MAPIDLSLLEKLPTHPSMLANMPQDHPNPFTACMELLDNSRDASATRVEIRGTSSGAITVQDDGKGMCPDKLHCALGLSCSDRREQPGKVGEWGVGLKSAGFRLAPDFCVLTVTQEGTATIGMLSRTLFEDSGARDIVAPLASWQRGSGGEYRLVRPCTPDAYCAVLQALQRYAGCCDLGSEAGILRALGRLGPRGTMVVLLCPTQELRVRQDDIELVDPRPLPGQLETAAPLGHRSLSGFVSLAYLDARMTIVVQGREVTRFDPRTQLLTTDRHTYTYAPQGTSAWVTIEFGFNAAKHKEWKGARGMLFYLNGRLIKRWEPLAFQKQGNGVGKDVFGVVAISDPIRGAARFVRPTRNKQDFEPSKALVKLSTMVREKAKLYWEMDQKVSRRALTQAHKRRRCERDAERQAAAVDEGGAGAAEEADEAEAVVVTPQELTRLRSKVAKLDMQLRRAKSDLVSAELLYSCYVPN